MPGTTSMHESNPLPEAHRVLTLAQEINGTLKSTMAVFGQTFGSVSPAILLFHVT
jgi:hypothetical protein